MKSLVVTPRDKSELRLINELLEKLDISVSAFSQEEMEAEKSSQHQELGWLQTIRI